LKRQLYNSRSVFGSAMVQIRINDQHFTSTKIRSRTYKCRSMGFWYWLGLDITLKVNFFLNFALPLEGKFNIILEHICNRQEQRCSYLSVKLLLDPDLGPGVYPNLAQSMRAMRIRI
jgi:hypothetical protein